MKNMILLCFILASVFSYSLAFEGEIKIKYNQFNGPLKIDNASWFFKSDLSMFQLNMKNDNGELVKSSFIPDKKLNSLIIFGDLKAEDGKNYFYNIPVKSISKESYLSAEKVFVETTDEIKIINTYKCRKVVVKTEQNTTEMWVAQALEVSFASLSSFFPANIEMLGMQKSKISGFPLKSVTKDLNGTVLFDFEVVSLSPSVLSVSDFLTPVGYIDSAKRE